VPAMPARADAARTNERPAARMMRSERRGDDDGGGVAWPSIFGYLIHLT